MFRDSSASTKIQVSVYHNLSGLVVLNSAGGIESANAHFVNLLFGCGSDDLKVQSTGRVKLLQVQWVLTFRNQVYGIVG